MNPICYRPCNDVQKSTNALRKECMTKAYRTLFNLLEENTDLKEELNLCMVNPQFITHDSLDEMLPDIYKSLEKISDDRITSFLRIYCPSALFPAKGSLTCPNIIFKLKIMYDC